MNKQELIKDLESRLKKIDEVFGDKTYRASFPDGDSVSLNAEEAKKLLTELLDGLKKK